MNERFDKAKKSARLNAIVKSVSVAVAAAFLTVDAVLLPCLLCGVHLLWVWYVLIGLAVFAAVGGVMFLFCRVDDRKIAKRLDDELGLSERVQTAYAYRDDSGDMLELQRADAEEALSSAPAIKRSVRDTVIAVALAAALVIGIVALPVIAVFADVSEQSPGSAQPVDPPRQVTDWEWEALDELIEYVRSSQKADEIAKAGMLDALEGLRNVLLDGVTQSGLMAFVQNAITEIRNAVGEANARADITDEGKANNSAEEEYVIAKLNEIFGLNRGGNSSDDPSGGDEPEKPVSPGNNTGTGELVTDGIPFFDPEFGYVSSGDTATREKYYNIIRQAMLEGTISRSEWEYIVATYFAELKDKDSEEE